LRVGKGLGPDIVRRSIRKKTTKKKKKHKKKGGGGEEKRREGSGKHDVRKKREQKRVLGSDPSVAGLPALARLGW